MEQCTSLKNCISEPILAVCRKGRLSLGDLQTPNDITRTPSGTLNNTALTLIQVLNLHRVLAVINLNSDEDYPAKILKRSDAAFLTVRILLFYFLLTGLHLSFCTLAVSVSFSDLWIF